MADAPRLDRAQHAAARALLGGNMDLLPALLAAVDDPAWLCALRAGLTREDANHRGDPPLKGSPRDIIHADGAAWVRFFCVQPPGEGTEPRGPWRPSSNAAAMLEPASAINARWVAPDGPGLLRLHRDEHAGIEAIASALARLDLPGSFASVWTAIPVRIAGGLLRAESLAALSDDFCRGYARRQIAERRVAGVALEGGALVWRADAIAQPADAKISSWTIRCNGTRARAEPSRLGPADIWRAVRLVAPLPQPQPQEQVA